MLKKYKEYVDFEANFSEGFLKEQLGKDSFKKYEGYVTNIKPRNIYTSQSETNFLKRYLLENFVIHLSLELLSSLYDISRNEILKQIPEINQYYMYQTKKEYYGFVPFKYSTSINFKSWLKSTLEDFFKTVDQREYGEYYTPEELIRLSFQELNIDLNHKVVDPSCGSGFFLLEYLEEAIKEKNYSNLNIEEVKQKIYGFDIFPFSIIMSKLLLGEFYLRTGQSVKKAFTQPNIIVHNTVKSLNCMENNSGELANATFDLIIGNPPFFRIEPNDKNEICSCVSYGHNYIQSIFVHWAMQHLNTNGVASLFLPQSILSGYYYQKLRRDLLEEYRLDMIVSDKSHEKSFLVQQDIMILYFSKREKLDTYLVGTPNKELNKLDCTVLPLNLTASANHTIPVFKEDRLSIAYELSKHPILAIFEEFNIGTGNFVWNQNKNIIFSDYRENAVPLIMGPAVTLNGIVLDTTDSKANYSYCLPDNEKYIKNEQIIVYRRMSPIGNEQRMIATIIDITVYPEYVLENHVNYIKHINNDSNKLHEMLQFITSEEFDILINTFCQTNQVSSNDLFAIFEILNELRS